MEEAADITTTINSDSVDHNFLKHLHMTCFLLGLFVFFKHLLTGYSSGWHLHDLRNNAGPDVNVKMVTVTKEN